MARALLPLPILLFLLLPGIAFAQGHSGAGGGDSINIGDFLEGNPSTGNDVTYPDNLPISFFVEHLNKSMIQILPFFRGFFRQYHQPGIENTIAHHLFDGSQTIFDLLPKITIQLHENTPCYNRLGEAVDGSVTSDVPNGICMSYFRMKNRLNKVTYRPQLSALLIHEMSHLTGTDEPQARALQRFALGVFLQIFKDDATDDPISLAYKNTPARVRDNLLKHLIFLRSEVQQGKYDCPTAEQIGNKDIWAFAGTATEVYTGNFGLNLVTDSLENDLDTWGSQFEPIISVMCPELNHTKPTTPVDFIGILDGMITHYTNFADHWKTPDPILIETKN